MKPIAWLALGFLSGCTLLGRNTIDLHASAETVRVLRDLDTDLRARDAEVRFHCSAAACRIRIDGTRQPSLESEMINHPLQGTPLAHRIHGGTPDLAGALYEALGRHTPTGDFVTDKGVLQNERELELENRKIKLRCVSNAAAPAGAQCWVLISARLLR